MDASGKILAKAEADFEHFARSTWWRSPAGIDHSVPAPWTPVRLTSQAVAVWGREYSCAGRVLPQQIVNQGVEILAAPIGLQLSAAGRTLDLADLPARTVSSRDDAVVRQAETRCGPLGVKLATTVEFDGLLRCDLTLSPDQPVDVSGLSLEIRVKQQYAAFLPPSNGIIAATGQSSRMRSVASGNGWQRSSCRWCTGRVRRRPISARRKSFTGGDRGRWR